MEMVKASKETISRYEGLLNKEMSIARMKVEVLDQQVRKLVEKVAQQPLISPLAQEKKTAEPSIAVVVPHPEQVQGYAEVKPVVVPVLIEGIAVAARQVQKRIKSSAVSPLSCQRRSRRREQNNRY